MNVIETSSLTRRFGDLTAVDGLNLAVDAGEVFGLLGPNGAGKTTVIKVAIMNLGRVAALGPPEELKASIGRPEATLDEVFAHYTGHELDNGGNYREISRARRTAARLG